MGGQGQGEEEWLGTKQFFWLTLPALPNSYFSNLGCPPEVQTSGMQCLFPEVFMEALWN